MCNCIYSCVVTAMSVHNGSFIVRCFPLSHSPVHDIDTCFFDFKSVCSCLCSATHYCNYKDHNKCHSPGHCPLCSAMLAVIIFGVLQSCDLVFALHAVQMLSGYEGPPPPSIRSTPSSTQQSLVSNVCVTLLHIVHYFSPAPCCQHFLLDQ